MHACMHVCIELKGFVGSSLLNGVHLGLHAWRERV